MKPDPAVDAAMHLIRQKILDGSWPSGAKIPTRCELAELVGTSASTIQAAMRKLVAEGSKADPAQVAKDGYEALLASKEKVISGFMNKVQGR